MEKAKRATQRRYQELLTQLTAEKNALEEKCRRAQGEGKVSGRARWRRRRAATGAGQFQLDALGSLHTAIPSERLTERHFIPPYSTLPDPTNKRTNATGVPGAGGAAARADPLANRGAQRGQGGGPAAAGAAAGVGAEGAGDGRGGWLYMEMAELAVRMWNADSSTPLSSRQKTRRARTARACRRRWAASCTSLSTGAWIGLGRQAGIYLSKRCCVCGLRTISPPLCRTCSTGTRSSPCCSRRSPRTGWTSSPR